jgi:hypothetical protein
VKTIALDDQKKRITLNFPYQAGMIERVKSELTDRSFYSNSKTGEAYWWVPADPWHAALVMKFARKYQAQGFFVSKPVMDLADKYGKKLISTPRENLYPFQSEGLDFLNLIDGRGLVADEQGLGKTITVLSWLGEHPEATKILVVCPASVTYKWEAECKKWLPGHSVQVVTTGKQPLEPVQVIIMSYAIMTNRYPELRKTFFDCIVADECFPYDVPVVTNRGEIPIGDIVEQQLPVEVLSQSPNGKLEWKKIVKYIKNPRIQSLVRIVHTKGELICTSNHPVYISGRGYVEASNLIGGDIIRYVSSDQDMFGVPQGISDNEKCREAEILLLKMCRDSEGRYSQTGTGGEVTFAQSYVDARSYGEGIEESRSIWPNYSWGKRTGVDCPTEKTFGFIGAGMDTRVPGEGRQYSRVSIELQGRYSESRIEDSYRSGWQFPFWEEASVRPEERFDVEESRVVSIESVQPNCLTEYSGSNERDQYVYCLEVEHNHNFFAGRVLVHNCQYVSNSDAKRTKAIKMLKSKYFLALSGTPFLNRPIELWSILNILYPQVWSNKWKFGIRYADGRDDGWGWKFDGASNLDELRDKLSHLMLRRLKVDVLSQLPELTRSVIPIEIANIAEYKREYKVVKSAVKADRHSSSLLAKLTALRQIIGKGKVAPAVELAEDILANADRKVVLYAHHKEVVRELTEQLKAYRPLIIVGDTPNEQRHKNAVAFQTDPAYRVMIISSAGGEGIDLFAAQDMIFVEREWNSGKEEQIEARLHRIGQKNAVVIHYIVAVNTIDEKMHRLIDSKRDILRQVIGLADIETSIVNDLLDEIDEE